MILRNTIHKLRHFYWPLNRLVAIITNESVLRRIVLNLSAPVPRYFTDLFIANMISFTDFLLRTSFFADSFAYGPSFCVQGVNSRTLGRRLTQTASRSNYTDVDFLSHISTFAAKATFDHSTVQQLSYTSIPGVHSDSALHRRFPRSHDGGGGDVMRSKSAAASEFFAPDNAARATPLRMLAQQHPVPPSAHARKRWRYSYHGLPACYPLVSQPDRRNPYPVWYVRGPTESAALAYPVGKQR